MVNIFFYVNNEFLIHEEEKENSLKYGKFYNFSESHFNIWNKYYLNKYHKDFDYYPRGRVIYNIETDTYYIYYDKCIKDLNEIIDKYKDKKYSLCVDDHYTCHNCNEDYIDISAY